MKYTVILILVVVGFFLWAKDWASSGKMDVYIAGHTTSANTPDILFFISQIYYYAEKPERAIRYFRWIIQDYPGYPRSARVRWQLGRCLENTGEKNLALEQYIVLKDSYTNTEEGRRALGKYQQIKY